MRVSFLFLCAAFCGLVLSTTTTSKPPASPPVAHLETIGSLVFEDDTTYQPLSVVWEFRALNHSVLEFPDTIPESVKQNKHLDYWLAESNKRILYALERKLPPLSYDSPTRTKRAVPGVIVAAGVAGLTGAAAGALITNAVLKHTNNAQRANFVESEYLKAYEHDIRLYADERIREYSQQLDSVLNPIYRPLVLNEKRIAEALKKQTGSGRVVSVEILNIFRKPPGPNNLVEIQSLLYVRSSASEHPLYRVHVGGHFTPSQRLFLKYTMPSLWTKTRNEWLEVDIGRCTKVDLLNATICRRESLRSPDRCNPTTLDGCPVNVEQVKNPFVRIEALAQSMYVVTTAKTYIIKNNTEGAELEYAVPKGGAFYLSVPPHSEIVVGTERRAGVGTVHQVFQSTEKIHLSEIEEQSIDAAVNYIAVGQTGQLKLQEFTFFNQLGNWFAENWTTAYVLFFLIVVLLVGIGFYACRRYHEFLCSKLTIVVQQK
ncbi:hypothetical protein M3Y99_00845700 [Aphelenchoides fujianensis]|nr:hypothetical protein M3Y99_00845700 [Aphelenchoides fujianensis]